MKAGIIGIVNGSFDEIPTFKTEILQDDIELSRGVEVTDTYELESGDTAVEGRAAKEELDSVETVNISEDGISWGERDEPVPATTRFAAVPGKFVIVGSGAGTFAYDLIGSACDAVIQRGKLNLDSLLTEHEEDTVWQLGFYGSGGHAEKGVVYGEDVLEDTEVGSILSLSNKNQLGIEYEYGEDIVRFTAAESGYFELYQPSSYETEEFLNFFVDQIWDHVVRPDN